jgi:hypothetical protein
LLDFSQKLQAVGIRLIMSQLPLTTEGSSNCQWISWSQAIARLPSHRKNMTSRAQVFVASIALLTCSAVNAQPAATRDQTLDDDLSGPAITWVGMISKVIQDADDTCFVVDRLTREAITARGAAFIACSGGSLTGEAYLPGAMLQVKGNLGAATRRLIGTQIFDLPLVAAAYVESVAPDRYQAVSPFYPSQSYYDPWYGSPWYYAPGISLGFSFHHHR